MPGTLYPTASLSIKISSHGRDVDPRALCVAVQHRTQNLHLTQAIDELWIFRHIPIVDGLVKAAKHLFEGIVIAFAVTAGKVGVAARSRLQQRGILDVDPVGRIPVALP
jgi:hypothetical protein